MSDDHSEVYSGDWRTSPMPDNLRTRIAAVHQAHRWGVFRCNDGYARTCCRCQWRETPDSPTHAEHVADAVIRELEKDAIYEARKKCGYE